MEDTKIPDTIKPFFVEEKVTKEGDKQILSTDVSEIVKKEKKTELLVEYIKTQMTSITTESIKSIDATVREVVNDYTIVVKKSATEEEHITFKVNKETNKVTVVNKEVESVKVELPKQV